MLPLAIIIFVRYFMESDCLLKIFLYLNYNNPRDFVLLYHLYVSGTFFHHEKKFFSKNNKKVWQIGFCVLSLYKPAEEKSKQKTYLFHYTKLVYHTIYVYIR